MDSVYRHHILVKEGLAYPIGSQLLKHVGAKIISDIPHVLGSR